MIETIENLVAIAPLAIVIVLMATVQYYRVKESLKTVVIDEVHKLE